MRNIASYNWRFRSSIAFNRRYSTPDSNGYRTSLISIIFTCKIDFRSGRSFHSNFGYLQCDRNIFQIFTSSYFNSTRAYLPTCLWFLLLSHIRSTYLSRSLENPKNSSCSCSLINERSITTKYPKLFLKFNRFEIKITLIASAEGGLADVHVSTP